MSVTVSTPWIRFARGAPATFSSTSWLTAALDDSVPAWINHAETIAFEYPRDRAELANRMDVLAVLAAEIDAGLAADGGA